MKWDDLPKELRERIVKEDPEHFNSQGLRCMGGLLLPERESDGGRALDSQAQTKQADRGRVARGGPVLRVDIISMRRRLITDSDNLPKGFKHLRDLIARFFDLDDADSVIQWNYAQVRTSGKQGTIVRIELLTKAL